MWHKTYIGENRIISMLQIGAAVLDILYTALSQETNWLLAGSLVMRSQEANFARTSSCSRHVVAASSSLCHRVADISVILRPSFSTLSCQALSQ